MFQLPNEPTAKDVRRIRELEKQIANGNITYDDLIPDEMERIEKEHNAAFGLPMLLMSLPVFLFDIPWYLMWIKIVEVTPYMADYKMLFYGICIGLFQAFLTLITMGYGLVAIPASILSFIVLVWLL